jgi:3-(3-hydroxy-phenyl)propionate hydroxylase
MMESQVVIIGAGPCGLTLASLLGLYGVRTVVIDRSADILDYPRAVGIDDEALRTFQTFGLADTVLRDMIRNVPLCYHDSNGNRFACINPTTSVYGWPRRSVFLQPLFEKELRRGLQRFSNVSLLLSTELLSFEETDREILVMLRHADGQQARLRCDYLVGADGGRSTVRRLVNVGLVGTTNPSRWLVVDADNSDIDQPFSGVYCDAKRPYMVIDLPYRHRRWEFMLLPGDDEQAIQHPETVARLINESKSASKNIRIKRSHVYTHHSRIAATFGVGRVFLAGDAAHLMPPFFGQGMNSGIRDAGNLAWKLAAVLQRGAHQRLLATYDEERRDHARQMVEVSTFLGRLFTPKTRLGEKVRSAFFKGIQKLPAFRDYIFQMRFKPMPRYVKGFVSAEGAKTQARIGTMFPQPTVLRRDGSTGLLDDVLGSGFAVIGYKVDPATVLPCPEYAAWKKVGAKIVHVAKARDFALGEMGPASKSDVVVEDVNGALRDWFLDRRDEGIAVIRPDRYIAALASPQNLPAMTETLHRYFGP